MPGTAEPCGNSNVVFIVVDALRRDAVGVYGGKASTPNIDKLARNAWIFENAYSVTNATDPGLTSILTGLYPSTHGVTQHGERVVAKHLSQLPFIEFLQEVLKRNGYVTIALDFLGRWHKRGFDIYVTPASLRRNPWEALVGILPRNLKSLASGILKYVLRRKGNDVIQLPYGAEELTLTAISILRKVLRRKERFFMLLHYWDTHFPYLIPRNRMGDEALQAYRDCGLRIYDLRNQVRGYWFNVLVKYYDNKCVNHIKAKYYAAATYVDYWVGEFMKFLEREGILDETVLIVTSDHGESLGEHGVWFDHHTLYEPSVQVPLIIRAPGFKGKKIRDVIQHVDLMPLILELLGIKINERTRMLDGIRLGSRDFIFAEEAYTERKFMIRVGKYKYIMAPKPEDALCRYCSRVHGGVEELYDLAKDPEERDNIINDEPEKAEELRNLLSKLLRNMLRKRLSMRIRIFKQRVLKT